MRRNKKGFSLIELLAVIVILGILIAFSIPVVTKYIKSTRAKSYLIDTNKLITMAEYKINSNSLNIEKPDSGNCIVFPFKYLDNGSLNSPPNKGKYDQDVSFVVIKNNGGTLEYSAQLIEKTNDGDYIGIGLSKQSQIKDNKDFSRMKYYNKDELIYVDSAGCSSHGVSTNREINVTFINDMLGSSYVSSIEKVYFYDDLEQGEAEE